MALKNVKKVRYEKIMGLDISTHSMAYGIISAGKIRSYGEIQFGGNDSNARLAQAARVLEAFINANNIDIDCVVIEDAVSVRSISTAIVLGKFVGLISGMLSRKGAPIYMVKPLEWQNYIGNKLLSKSEKEELKKEYPGKSAGWYRDKGRELRKQRTIQYIKDNYNIEVTSDNVADALALSVYADKMYGVKNDIGNS